MIGRLAVALLLASAVAAASAQPCQDRLQRIEPTTARAGETIVLVGAFAPARQARRPVANRGQVFDLEVVHWGPQRIVARLPGALESGEYKVGIYCDGRPGPERFLHASAFVPLPVQAQPEPLPVPQRRPQATTPQRPTALQFEVWLSQQAELVDELVWEGRDGPELYASWPDARRAALYQAFQRSVEGAVADPTPPPNRATTPNAEGALLQRLDAAAAEALYLDAVGHSLALDYRAALPWSLRDYPLAQREILLDAREFFRFRDGEYELEFGRVGMALPSPAAVQWAFLSPLLGSSRQSTIVAVLDWLRDHALHFEGRAGAETMQQQWQYPGYPPVARVLAGTPHLGRPQWPVRPRTAGCFGTAGFLRALLRAANIPVRMASRCAHYQVHFPSEGLYLSHGDDPYSGDFRATGCSSERLLLSETTWQHWFGETVAAQHCDNVGRAAREMATCM